MAWTIGTVVRMPTFMPRFFASSATDSRRRPSGVMPSAPLFAFSPHAMAVAAAAESVITAFAARVRVVHWQGSAFIASGPVPVARLNSSATIRCGVDIPSPMKRNTYFGAAAHAATETATRPRNRRNFIPASSFIRTSKHETRAVCAGSLVNGGGKRS